MNFLYRHRAAFGFFSLFLAVAVTFGFCFFALSKTTAESLRLTVVIDAGHGGIDGGVVGVNSGVKESVINLEISRMLQQEFEDAGFRVVLTRETEAGLYGAATTGYKKRDMKKREEIINASNPALVLSVHQNFFSLSSRRGAQVFFREDNEQSVSLACMIQSALNAMPECVRQSEPLKGDYYILNSSYYTAVLIEFGFLSNPNEEVELNTDEYMNRLIDAVVKGVMLHFGNYQVV